MASMTCEYCGTGFKEEHDNLIRIETFHNPVVTLGQSIRIDHHDFYMSPDQLSKYAIEKLAREFAEVIAPYMDIESRFSPYDSAHILDARIKIVKPIHKPNETMSQLKEECYR
jgi:hypothetical protein